MHSKYRLLTYYPIHILNYGIGHAALSITTAMNSDRLSAQIIAPSSANSVQSPYLHNAIPSFITRILYKLNLSHVIQKLSENYFMRKLKPTDIAYLWPGTSLMLYHKVKAKGNLIVTENINCHQKSSKKILEDEATKLDIINFSPIAQESIDDELTKHRLSDYIFSPSPLVTKSLLNSGVPDKKILESSYGLHREQQSALPIEQPNSDKPIVAIFVGRVGMRKGIHLLLDYWVSAHINGILKIIGNIEQPIRKLIEPYRSYENIQFVSFVEDVEKEYRDADIFVLPSLEEGSPLVTYLALGAGLPCIVSPMAGAGVITNGNEGFIIAPHDKQGWITALQKLFSSEILRKSQSKAAREASNTFLWENVGKHRSNLLLDKLQGN